MILSVVLYKDYAIFHVAFLMHQKKPHDIINTDHTHASRFCINSIRICDSALCKVQYLCAIIALTKAVWHILHLQVKKVNLAIQMLINSLRNVHFSSRKINRSCFLEYFLCACLLLKIKTLITNFRDVHKNDCTFLPIT